MTTTRKPGSCDNTMTGRETSTDLILTSQQYNQFIDRMRTLETDAYLRQGEFDSAIWALSECHRDMPAKWSQFIVEVVYPAKIPENVRILLRQQLPESHGGMLGVAL